MGIIIERNRPSNEAHNALDAALRAKLGDRFEGCTCRHGHVEVFLSKDATAEDDNIARQIVLHHDFNERTPKQKALAAHKEKRLALRREVKTDAKALGKTDELAALKRQVEWLTMEYENLLERFGDE